MTFLPNKKVLSGFYIGSSIAAVFAIFDSFINYLDTAPINESIPMSLSNIFNISLLIKFLVYLILGGCIGVIGALGWTKLCKKLYISKIEKDAAKPSIGLLSV